MWILKISCKKKITLHIGSGDIHALHGDIYKPMARYQLYNQGTATENRHNSLFYPEEF